MEKKKKKIVVAIISLLVVMIGILSFKYLIFDKYDGKVLVKNLKSYSNVLSANVSSLTDEASVSEGYDTIRYTIKYTLSNSENITRDVTIKAKLTARESKYARFRELKGNNITSTVSADGILINLEDIPTNEEQELTLELVISNAPYGFKFEPTVTVKEDTSDEKTINLNEVTVSRNSIEGFVIDTNGNTLSSIELALFDGNDEIKRTYTNTDGEYVFGNLDSNKPYNIRVVEDKYKKVRLEERSTSDEKKVFDVIVKSVDPFELEINKYITKLDLIINGNKNTYTYNDAVKVLRSVKNAKSIEGSITYKITIKNNGEIDGTIGSIQDIVPKGLSFDSKKNPGWEEKKGKLYYRVLEENTLSSYEERVATLVLDIVKTNEAKTYINEAIGKSNEYKNVVFLIDGVLYKDINVLDEEVIDEVKINDGNFSGWYTDPNYTNKYNFKNKVTKNMILYGSLTNTKCNVTFIDDGNVLKEETISCGDKVSSISVPGKLGYTFKYWTLNNQEYDFDSKVTTDIVLTSYYEIETYNITYELNGGTLEISNPITYTVESDNITLNNPTKEGYTFDGWTGSNGTTAQTTVIIPSGSTGDMEYTANFSINSYTLFIDPNGGVYEGSNNTIQISNDYGTTITVSNPTRNGYEFTGWTLEGKGTLSDSSYTYGDGNGRLIANYTPKNYTITYNLDGGSVSTNNPENYTIESEPITLHNPTKAGFTFTGWSGTDITNPSTEVTIPAGSTGNRTYTANYSINAYTLTVNPNGGIYNNSSNPVNIENDFGTVITLDTPTRNGYNFTGWTLTGNGSLVENTYTYADGNGTVTANWEVITYNITYNGLTTTEETALSNPTEYNVEMSFSLTNPQNRLDDEGDIYERFTGWTYRQTTETNVTIPVGTTGDIEFTANFAHVDPDTYIIAYDLDGGSVSTNNPTTYTKKDNAITLNNPTKEGYTFAGWIGTGLNEATITVTIPHGSTGDRSYTATYTPIEYTITYEGLTQSEITALGNPTKYTIETNTFDLANPTREGYTFSGWTGSNGDVPSNVTIEKGTIGNKTYTANFVEDGYTINYNLDGGSVSTPNPISYTVESAAITLNNPTKDGYTFAGWIGTGLTEPTKNVTIPHGSTGDRNYTATYTIIEYTISYDGITQAEIEALGNPSKYTVETETFNLTNPSRIGYRFTGWTGSNGDNPSDVTITKGSTGNKNYTAHFEKIIYNISYNLKGGVANPENPISYTIESDTITLTNPIKEGYTFLGWTGTDYPGLTTQVTIPAGSIGDRTFEAHYNTDEYTITYNGLTDEEKTSINNPTTYTIETNTFSLNNPTRQGYTFTGWTGTNGDNPQLIITINKGSTGNKEYTANFDIDSYTVTYKNGGTVHATDIVEYNNKTTAPVVNPTKEHSFFSHWSLEENGTPFDFDTLITSDTTLYAVFTPIDAPVITHTPTSWTNDKVLVNVTSEHNDYEYYYKVGDSEYTKFTTDFEVSENTTVYAYSSYGNGTSVEVSHVITNIDKINPSIESSETPYVHTVDLNMSFIDNESGVKSYKIYLDNDLLFESSEYIENLNEEKNEMYTLTSLDASTQYTYRIELTDVAGNVSEYEKTVTTENAIYVSRIVGMGGIIFDDESQYILFESLQAAIDYCDDTQCTIEIIPDELEESVTITQGQDIKLNLDGKTLYSSELSTIENNGKLLIVDDNENVLSESKILNTNPAGKTIVNNGELIVGYNDGTVSIKNPLISASNIGIDNNGTLRFFDGKVKGNETVHGEVNETPYSYNATIKPEDDKEVMILQIVEEPEARIQSKYYTKLSKAMDESKIGTTEEEESKLLSQIVQVGEYGFIYNSNEDYIISENTIYENTTAISMLELDLTDYEENQFLNINYTISSSSRPNYYGYVTILDTPDTIPAFDQTNGRVLYVSGHAENYNRLVELTPGKKYYVYFGYRKTDDFHKFDDYFKINALFLTGKGSDNFESMTTNSTYSFVKTDKHYEIHDLSGGELTPIYLYDTITKSPQYNSSNGSLEFTETSIAINPENNVINPGDEETVDIEFSLNRIAKDEYIYAGNNNENIAIGFVNKKLVVASKQAYSTFIIPDNLTDFKKHRVTVSYKNDNGRVYVPYIDGIELEMDSSSSSYSSTDTRTYIGGNVNRALFEGSIYNVKVYNKAVSPTDIDNNLYEENVILHYDFSDPNCVSTVNDNVFAPNAFYGNPSRSYLAFDLRDKTEPVNVTTVVASYISDGLSTFYANITDSATNYGPTNGGARVYVPRDTPYGYEQAFTLTLQPGVINYLHYGFNKDNKGDQSIIIIKDIFIDKVQTENRIYEREITHDGQYHFEKYNSVTIKDLAGNNDYIDTYPEHRYNSVNKSLDFNSNPYSFTSNLSFDNKETVDIEYSSTNTRDQALYVGSNGEKIGVGFFSGYVIVSNTISYQTYKIPANALNGAKHRITIKYDDGEYTPYIDGILLENNGTVRNLWNSNGYSYIAGCSANKNFNGSIYSIKIYDEAYDITDIDSDPENSHLKFYYNISDSRNVIVDNIAYINNNQRVQNSTAHSYIEYDLTSATSDIYAEVNYTISSQNNYDFGYIDLTDTPEAPSRTNKIGRYVYVSNQSTGTAKIKLNKGKINYLHFSYYKNGGTDSYMDSFIINSIKYVDKNEDTYTINSNRIDNDTQLVSVPRVNENVDRIELLKDITIDYSIEIPKEKEVILDLNGHRLTSSKTDYVINNKGKLVIDDSKFGNEADTIYSTYLRDLNIYNSQIETIKNDIPSDFFTELGIEPQINVTTSMAEEYLNTVLGVSKPVLDYSSLTHTGELTSSSYSTVLNDDYANLEIGNAILSVKRNGKYSVIDNQGTLKFNKNAVITANNQNNIGINNSTTGSIIPGESVDINAIGREAIGINDYSAVSQHISNANISILNDSSGIKSYTLNNRIYSNISVNGTGTGILSRTLYPSTYNDININASRNGILFDSAASIDYKYAPRAVFNNAIITNNATSNVSINAANNIDVVFNNSEFYRNNGDRVFWVFSGKLTLNNSYVDSNREILRNRSVVEINDSTLKTSASAIDNASFSTSRRGKLSINSSSIEVKYNVSDGPLISNNGDLFIKDTNISNTFNKKHAIYNKEDGSTNITGNSVISGTFDLAINNIGRLSIGESNKKYSNVYNFDYVGHVQEFEVPKSGNYRFETWGASGGNTGDPTDLEGGKGAYTAGDIYLEAGTKLYIYVGEKGLDGRYYTNFSQRGSYNGGTPATEAGGAGGGATDISISNEEVHEIYSRFSNGRNENKQFVRSLDSYLDRIMVAGAGGGTSDNGLARREDCLNGLGLSVLGVSCNNIVPLTGSQTTGNFGYFDQRAYSYEGKGAGYFVNTDVSSVGIGGTSYISGHEGSVAMTLSGGSLSPISVDGNVCTDGTTDVRCSYHTSGYVFTNTIMKAGYEDMPTFDGTGVMKGNFGHGHAKITYLDDYSIDTIKQDYPSISGTTKAIFSGGTINNSLLYFYGGQLNGASSGAIDSEINLIPNDTEIYSDATSTNEKLYLVSTSSTEEEYYEAAIVDSNSNIISKYVTVKDAVEAAPTNSQTNIILLKNVSTAYGVTIPDNKDIVIDYKGYYLRSYASGYAFVNNGTLLLKSSVTETQYSIAYGDGYILNNGTMNVDSLYLTTHYNTDKYIVNNSSLTFNNVSYSVSFINSYYTSNYSITNNENATLNIIGGQFQEDFGSYVLVPRILNNYGTSYIKDTSITTGGRYNTDNTSTIYHINNNRDGHLEMDNVTINKLGTYFVGYILYNDGNAIIKNSTIDNHTIINNYDLTYKDNTLGSTKTTATIGRGDSSTSFDGGTYDNDITLEDNSTLLIKAGTYTKPIVSNSTGDVYITGGTINVNNGAAVTLNSTGTITVGEKNDGETSITAPSITGSTIGVNVATTDSYMNFYDGIINGQTAIKGTVNDVETNYSIAIENNSGIESKYLIQSPIIKNLSNNIEYTNINTAFSDAVDGDTLQLLRETVIPLTTPSIVNTKDITFDLNNHRLEVSNNFIINNNSLTIINSPYDISNSEYNTSVSNILSRMNNGEIVYKSYDYYSVNYEQVFVAPYTGTYKISAWGAQGGDREDLPGGYGGYSVGEIELTEGEKLFINVGQRGTFESTSNNGGYNGGGKGYRNGASGGGATSVATKSGLLSTLSGSIEDVIIVSGGGAGSSLSGDTRGMGGSAGGYKGVNGTQGNGGSQTAGGTGQGSGSFGIGASGSYTGYGGAGAGSGFYGGGSGYGLQTSGGGSSYIGNDRLTNKTMYCYECDESSDVNTKTISVSSASEAPKKNTPKIGDGFVRIALLSTPLSNEINYSINDARGYVETELGKTHKDSDIGEIHASSLSPIVTNNGTLTINSGIFSDEQVTSYKSLFNNNGTMIINDGTFNKYYAYITDFVKTQTSTIDNSGTLVVNYGKFSNADKYKTDYDGSSSQNTFIYNREDADANIKGGIFNSDSLTSTNANGRLFYNKGDLTISNIQSNYSSLGINDGTVTLNDVIMTNLASTIRYQTDGSNSRCQEYSLNCTEEINIGLFNNFGTVNINGGSYVTDSVFINNYSKLNTNELDNRKTSIYRKPLAVVSYLSRNNKDKVITLEATSESNLNGIILSGIEGTHLISVSTSGDTNISNSKITSNVNTIPISIPLNSDSPNAVIGAITLDNVDVYSESTYAIVNEAICDITVSGESSIISNADRAIDNKKESTITVGTKSDGIVSTIYPVIRGKKHGIYSSNSNSKLNFYDGIIKGTTASFEIPISDIESGYGIIPGTEAIDGLTYKTSYLDKVEVVINARTLEKYEDLASAFSYAEDGDTLEMINNFTTLTTDSSITIDDNITLDLKGFDINQSIDYLFINNGTFTITDSSQNQDGLIYAVSGISTIDNYGELTIDGANLRTKLESKIITNRINATADIINESYLYSDVDSNIIDNYGEMNIIDSKIQNDLTGKRYNSDGAIINNDGAILNIKDSILNSKNGYYWCNAVVSVHMEAIKNSGTVTLDNINTDENTNMSLIYNMSTGNAIIKNIANANPFSFGYNEGTMEITNIDNHVISSACGATIFNVGTLEVTDSVFYSDVTNEFINSSSNLTIDNVDIEAPNKNVAITTYRGTSNINDLTIKGTTDNPSFGRFEVDAGTLNLSNSSIEYGNGSSNLLYVRSRVNSRSLVNIESTDLVSKSTTAALFNCNEGDINILSGTLTATNDAIYVNNANGIVSLGTNDSIYNSSTITIRSGNLGALINAGTLNFYDGTIYGINGGIYGHVGAVEDGYKIRTAVEDGYNVSYLSLVGSTEAVAESNGITFDDLQIAVNYAVRNNTYVTLVEDYTLTYDLVASAPVDIYLAGNTFDPAGYNVSSNITIKSGTYNTSGSVSNILGNILGIDNNKKMVIIYEMDDGTSLSPSVSYRLYKDDKLQKIDEEEAGTYIIGTDEEILKPIKGRIYISNVKAGNYKLVGSDNKEVSFIVTDEGELVGNVKEYNVKDKESISNAKAELILSIQTGVLKINYLLVAVSLIAVLIIMFIINRKSQNNKNLV